MTLVLPIDAIAPSRPARPRRRAGLIRRLARLALIGLGAVTVVAGVLISPLPGPFGLPVAVVGLMLILRNSYWAKRQFIRLQKIRPNWVFPFRRLMRRRPEVAPVFWQQALRLERLLLRRGRRWLGRLRRAHFRRAQTA